jgi:hypothetical protein
MYIISATPPTSELERLYSLTVNPVELAAVTRGTSGLDPFGETTIEGVE